MKKVIKSPKGKDILGRVKADKTVEIELVPNIRRDWYEYVTPLLGIKWGATVTLIGYTWINNSDNDGLKLACIVVAVFLAVEWLQMAWREFKYRGQR